MVRLMLARLLTIPVEQVEYADMAVGGEVDGLKDIETVEDFQIFGCHFAVLAIDSN